MDDILSIDVSDRFDQSFTKCCFTRRRCCHGWRCWFGVTKSISLWNPAPEFLLCVGMAQLCRAEMEAGLEVTCLRLTGSAILAGSGPVTGQCVRPGVWPGLEF